jgi:hypothetical protein
MLFPICGCDSDRLSRLEKQNEELKAKIAKDDTVRDFDLQAKCSRDAKTWFNENYAGSRNEKDTLLLTYINHYNKAGNQCFIFVEYHFSVGPQGLHSKWINDMTLWDVYENAKDASFAETHGFNYKDELEINVDTCDLFDKKCKTADEYNKFIQGYMNN